MTPEELDRKIVFIIETQAHLSASLDSEREMREERMAQFEKSQSEMKSTQKNLAGLQAQMVQMIRIESERLDRSDRLHEEARGATKRCFNCFGAMKTFRKTRWRC